MFFVCCISGFVARLPLKFVFLLSYMLCPQGPPYCSAASQDYFWFMSALKMFSVYTEIKFCCLSFTLSASHTTWPLECVCVCVRDTTHRASVYCSCRKGNLREAGILTYTSLSAEKASFLLSGLNAAALCWFFNVKLEQNPP